jgi:peptide methionine sulfoxide reductase MsrA
MEGSMTIDGIQRLVSRKECLEKELSRLEEEQKQIDTIRHIRFYQPNPTDYYNGRPDSDEKYSSVIYDTSDGILGKVKKAYADAVRERIILVKSEIVRVESFIKQAEDLLSQLDEEVA